MPASSTCWAPRARAAPRIRHSNLLAALIGAGAIAVAGSAVAFAAVLGGGGAQPEDVLPASALGMVKLDLDPSASQKIAVYRLAERFPSLQDQVQDSDSVKDELLSALFENQDDIDYEADIQPWIGDRVGAALLPGTAGSEDEPQPLMAIAYTDRAAAEKAMKDLQADDEEAFYAFSANADYVLLGTSQEAVDGAARTSEVLADAEAWDEGMDALDGDQIVTLWADLDAVYDALPQEAREQAAEVYGLEGDVELGGTVVLGAHAADDHVEVVGKALEVESPVQLENGPGTGTGSDLLAGLPEDTVAALSVTHLGAGLAGLFETAYGADDPLGIVASAQELGLSLPGDLETLLGEETLLARSASRTSRCDCARRTRTRRIAPGRRSRRWRRRHRPAMLRALDDGLASAATRRRCTQSPRTAGSGSKALPRRGARRRRGRLPALRRHRPGARAGRRRPRARTPTTPSRCSRSASAAAATDRAARSGCA
jgi:hypothetical protein